ncbi:TetR/AcrR family transcriptional regulator [Mesorhizobium captivum]|uniref:TetR/AcrR family transcriptional regulator n=1 Tax=Mesorhizobium captivum TaxID=3072319 RepID=UPI003D314097
MTSSSLSRKRQHVVDTAYSLFKRDGFHATGVDRIIAEAGIACAPASRSSDGRRP